MALAVGVAASIMGVIQVTGSLLTLTSGYIGTVRSATREIEDLQKYLQDFSETLKELQNRANDDPQMRSLRRYAGVQGTLQRCITDLKTLHSKLSLPDESRFAKLIRLKRLKWPLKAAEVHEFITRMRGHESNFNMALCLDNLAVTQDVRSMVQGLQYEAITQASSRKRDALFRQNMESLHSDDPLGWLYMWATNVKHQEIHSSRRAGTGAWFLRSPQFSEFISERPHGSILWAHGIPGVGKTYITSCVIDMLQESREYGVAYIYFDYKDIQQHNPTIILASLVKQLVSQAPRMPSQIEALRENLKKDNRKANLDELYAALIALLSSFPRIFLVFDALDECEAVYQGKLLLLLRRMEGDRFNIFLTSRTHSGNISLSLENTPQIQISANDEDIAIYVKDRLDEHPQARRLLQSAQYHRVVSDIQEYTQGIFLLVRFYINHLCNQTTEAAISETLEQLRRPNDQDGPLDFIYERAIETINGQHGDRKRLALKVLSWLVKAKRTLTFEEMQVAVSINPEQQCGPDGPDLPSRTTLLDVCASLVTIDEYTKTVRLVHYTAQEYLVGKSLLPDDTDLQHAITCANYLSSVAFAKGACTSSKDYQERVQEYPFLQYSARYLSLHLNACDENETAPAVRRFLESQGNLEAFQQVNFLTTNPGYYFDRYPKGRTPLHLAASIGHSIVAKQLLEEGADIWAMDSDKRTALHCAATEGHEAISTLLLKKGAYISHMDRNTPYKAGRLVRQALIRLLTESRPLHRANNAACLAAIRLLVGRRNYISAVDGDGKTALHWAVERGCEGVVKLLIAGGANLKIKDNYGKTPLHSAAGRGRDGLVLLLLEKGADIEAKDHSGQTPLRLASAEGHELVVQVLLENGAEIIAPAKSGQTSLHNAAFNGHEGVIRVLVRMGIDIDILDHDGDPPLHNAVVKGYLETTELLIDLGADISIMNKDGQTALHWAANSGSEMVTQTLIRLKNDMIFVRNNDGRTPLHQAAYKGHAAVIKLLMERGAEVTALDNCGNTALHLAAHKGHVEVARLLIGEGIDISTLNTAEDSAFHLAASKGHMPVIQLLIESVADISSMGRGGKTALHSAASRGDLETAKLFIERGIHIEALDSEGRSALHWAADRARDAVVCLLLKQGALTSILDGDGKTPLHWAAYRGNLGCVELLIQSGADISILDGNGKTALQVALDNRRVAVVNQLEKAQTGIPTSVLS